MHMLKPKPVPDEKPVCDDPMGVSNELMADVQITVSSELGPDYSKKHLKINDNSAWQPLTNSPTEFVEVNTQNTLLLCFYLHNFLFT